MASRESIDKMLNDVAALLEGNAEEQALFDERMRRTGIYVYRGVIYTDAEPEVRAKNDAAYRWEQIGAHEFIHRSSGDPYLGPDATDEERERALVDYQGRGS